MYECNYMTLVIYAIPVQKEVQFTIMDPVAM